MLNVTPITRTVQPAVDALAAFLCGEGYSQHARGVILSFAAAHGTLEGLVEAGDLEPADEAAAEAAFVGGFEPLGWTDPAWDEYAYDASRAPVYIDRDSLLMAAGGGLVAIPPELDDADADNDGPPYLEESYEPTEQDWADYGAFLAALDREQIAGLSLPPIAGGSPEAEATPEQALAEEMREWYKRNPIAGFNAIRPDVEG